MDKAEKYHVSRAQVHIDDEFYTRYDDIEESLEKYHEDFWGKVVYCNTDNPYKSNFPKYFMDNYHTFRLAGLIVSHYEDHARSIFELDKVIPPPKMFEYYGYRSEPLTFDDVDIVNMVGDGDFRSREAIELLKKCDIVVTNPPFSLTTDLLRLLLDHKKDYIYMGTSLKILQKDHLREYQAGRLFFDKGVIRDFLRPDGSSKAVSNTTWITNLNRVKLRDIEYSENDVSDVLPGGKYIKRMKDMPSGYTGSLLVPVSIVDYDLSNYDVLGLCRESELPDGTSGFTRVIIRQKGGLDT